MLTAKQAFGLGHAVPMVGIYLEGTDLLAQAGRGASPDLTARLSALIASFEGRKSGVIANVRRVESLLSALGVAGGPPPRIPADYAPWAHRILTAVEGALKPAHLELATLHLLGRLTGEALEALNLASFELHLLEAAPGHAWLTEQLDRERVSLRRLDASIRGASAMLAPPASTALVTLASELAAGAPDLAATQASLRRCSDAVDQIEATLAG
jgi:hypothetical protein